MENHPAETQVIENGSPPPPENKEDTSHANGDLADPQKMAAPGDSATRLDDLSRDQVLCDSCMESPSRAVKSCLTCLVSYCQTHLRPHLEKAKFQNHRLVEPLLDIDGRVCEEHRLPLELFCLLDQCCACRDCESQEHQGHDLTSIGDARKQMEVELQRKQEEISQTVGATEKAVEKLQRNNASIEEAVSGARALMEQEFNQLQAAVEEARRGAVEALEGQQRQALRQAQGIQAHLEQKRAELKKTLIRIDKLFRNKGDIDFLQEYSDWKRGAVDVTLPMMSIGPTSHLTYFSQSVTDTTQALRDLVLSQYRERFQEMCRSGIKTLVLAEAPKSQSVIAQDPVTREDFLKYTAMLTFDPDTTHHFLRLTDGNRKVTNTSPWQHDYHDNPGRFTYWRQAMALESMYMGRHYLEAELSGEGTHVGITYKSIDRKGDQESSCITGTRFAWCLGCSGRGFSVWHADEETPLEASGITRIGLYVDFDKGSVAFYDVGGSSMILLHAYEAEFMEPLYVVCWLSKKDNTVALVSTESLPVESAATPQ